VIISRDIPGATNKLPATTLLDHLLCSRTIAIKHPKHVDLKHASNIIFCQIKKGLHLCDAGIRDHDIQGTEVLDAGLDESFDFGELGNVCSVAVGLATEGLYLFNGLQERLAIFPSTS